MALLSLQLVVAVLLAPALGHIHSQKITGGDHDLISLTTWLLCVASAVAVGACGVLPLLLNRWVNLDNSDKTDAVMQAVLSFAVGGLLGDVFLHLLPEAWGPHRQEEHLFHVGVWVLAGLLVFMCVEKLAKATAGETSPSDSPVCSNSVTSSQEVSHERSTSLASVDKAITGYLNLIANCTDNFTHGLAIAASYMASPLVGALTTLAIICHEIPHEVGDFAILLRSGFNTRTAAKAQIFTAGGGLVGVVVGLLAEQIGHCTSWMLPFTAGGFLYIALVSILPELLESEIRSLRLVLPLLAGISVMAGVIVVEKKSCSAMLDL